MFVFDLVATPILILRGCGSVIMFGVDVSMVCVRVWVCCREKLHARGNISYACGLLWCAAFEWQTVKLILCCVFCLIVKLVGVHRGRSSSICKSLGGVKCADWRFPSYCWSVGGVGVWSVVGLFMSRLMVCLHSMRNKSVPGENGNCVNPCKIHLIHGRFQTFCFPVVVALGH